MDAILINCLSNTVIHARGAMDMIRKTLVTDTDFLSALKLIIFFKYFLSEYLLLRRYQDIKEIHLIRITCFIQNVFCYSTQLHLNRYSQKTGLSF